MVDVEVEADAETAAVATDVTRSTSPIGGNPPPPLPLPRSCGGPPLSLSLSTSPCASAAVGDLLRRIGAAALRPLVNALGGHRPRCRRPRRHSRHHRRRRCYDSYIGGCHRRRPADAEPVGRRAAALGVVITVAVFAGDQRPRSTLATATADVADAAVVADLQSSLDQRHRYVGCQRLRRCSAGCRSRRRPSTRRSSALLFLIKQFFLISVASEAN